MDRENALSTIASFDTELYTFFQEEVQRQKYTLSFMPEENYSSPLSTYLEGSILSNTLTTHHDEAKPTGLEEITINRINKLFGSEHAVIRLESIAAASRVVFYSLAKKGDTILSLDNRKSDHCNSKNLEFNFVRFSIDPKTQLLNLDRVEQIAKEHKPKVIIFSPVNYPRVIDYERLAKIAHDIGAYMWFDICQNVGLVATGQIPSPVPYADVVTFSTHDSLRGPQSSVILCKKELADIIDKTIITTGHFSLKKNILASLAVIFKEATTEKFKQYTKQVVLNAKALQKGLEEEGITILCKGTDTNLVLVNLTKLGISCKKAHNALQSAGFIVKPTVLSTCDENLNFEILRLSSLILTTRGLKEVQMEHIGKMMAKVLKNIDDMAIIEEVRQEAVDIAMECPLFSDEWLAFKDVLNPLYSAKDINISHELAAERKMAVMKKLFSFMKK